LVADRRQEILVGAWAVAPMASEWIHYAALAIKAKIPLSVLRDSPPQFPTYTEAYVKALARLEL
jgi:dihydrolipoamide dehydrogenase